MLLSHKFVDWFIRFTRKFEWITSRMNNIFIILLRQIGSLTEEQVGIIYSAFTRTHYKDGEEILKEGRICKQLFFINSGILRIVSNNENGEELTHYFYKQNQFCTILQSFNNQVPSLLGIKAVGDVCMHVITKDQLLRLYTGIPAFKELIEKHNQERLLEKIQSRNDYQGREAEARYRLFLEQHGDIVNQIAIKDIASYIGITRQSLSRIRRNMTRIK